MPKQCDGLSTIEARFDRFRRRAGFILAPLAFAALSFVPVGPDLGWTAHRLLAVMGLVITLWVTEALPLPVTALLGPALCVLLGIGPAKDVFKNFADPVIFLFLGSFLLAEAMLTHGLNRRMAFHILGLNWANKSPARLLAALGTVTALVSMWISNTAATAMMLPICLAILGEIARNRGKRLGHEIRPEHLKFGASLMLTAAYASSLGGIATPVGTPPNLITMALIEKNLGKEISFFQWMIIAVPLTAILVSILILYLSQVCKAEPDLLADSARWLNAEKEGLGQCSRAEWNVLMAFGMTATLWLLPGAVNLLVGGQHPAAIWINQRVPESTAALFGAAILFAMPTGNPEHPFTLSWNEAKRIDWGTILLFGGGLVLGEMMITTGLAKWLGNVLVNMLHIQTTLGLTALFTVVAIVLTETASNTATATMVVPLAIAVSQAAGANPLMPALGACFGASMAFMLPVSTPPNAIVYGSGCIPVLKMIKYGLILDVLCAVVIVMFVWWWVPKWL